MATDGDVHPEPFDPSDIALEVRITGIDRVLDDESSFLRDFSAVVVDGDSPTTPAAALGVVGGWIGWDALDEDVHGAADAVSSDAEALGATAADIIAAYPERWVDTVVLVDRMWLEPRWRHHRLSGRILADLVYLLRLDRDSTVIVLQPEPQREEGGPYEYGPKRDAAMAALRSGYANSGLEPWRGGDRCWWPWPQA
ncbi:hypothetical protein [Cellulomonas sp. PhB143]|uniref:hypothetical protein n=1 Tax=Cellulomonas sp. PhB143 TaxID=2485186 RepID=UPI0011CE061E|nr:hypothetical protein [Cellulomonas sp. PhB143]